MIEVCRIRYILFMIWGMILVEVLPSVIAQRNLESPTLDFEMGFALPHRCGILSPDESYMLGDNRVVYDMRNGEVVLEADFFALSFDPRGHFSPNGRYIRTPDGVYDLAQHAMVFNPGDVRRFIFSLDGGLLFVEDQNFETTVYSTETWEPITEVAPNRLFISDFGTRGIMPWITFDVPPGLDHYTSPDLRWTPIASQGIYDLENAQFATLPESMVQDEFVDLGMLGSVSAFSPDGSIFMIMEKGAFEAETWKFLYDLPEGVYLEVGESNLEFSLDGSVFTIQQTNAIPKTTFGIYDTRTGQALYLAEKPLNFSPNLAYFAVEDDGIYDFVTGERLFEITGSATFSADDNSVIVWDTGVYDTLSGERRFDLTLPEPFQFEFSRDGRFLFQSMGVLNLQTGTFFDGIQYTNVDNLLLQTVDYGGAGACLLYGQDRDWVRQSGLIEVASDTLIYDVPDGEVIGETSLGGNLRVVFSISEGGDWYRIFPGQWINVADVISLEIPDGVPIESLPRR